MTLLMLRLFFLILCVMGSWSISQLHDQWAEHPLLAILIGLAGGGLFIGVDRALKGFSLRGLSAASFGILVGFTISYFIGNSVLFKFIDEEPKLIGLVPRPLLVLEEFNEATDLGPENDRQQRLHQEVHGAKRIRLLQLRSFDVVGGHEDDRRVLRAALATHEFGRLEPAQTRQQHVEEDDGEFARPYPLKGILARIRIHEVQIEVFEDRSQRQEVGRVVVHQENAGLRFHRSVPN